MSNKTNDQLPRRALGKTGCEISVVGIGAIVLVGMEQNDANNLFAEAFDRGLNYVDTGPLYGQGEGEAKLGPATEPYRDKIFIAGKTNKRDRKTAEEELHTSLKSLRTDHLDLYQMHSLVSVEKDVERALQDDGAIPLMIEARDKGLVRFLGFSAHTVEAALAAVETGLFDTILFPTNFFCCYHSEFNVKPLKAAEERGMGRLALKAMARTRWPDELPREERKFSKCWYEPIEDPKIGALALRWTLSQGISVAIPPGDERIFRLALDVPDKTKPLDPEELAILESMAPDTEPIFPGPVGPRKRQPAKA